MSQILKYWESGRERFEDLKGSIKVELPNETQELRCYSNGVVSGGKLVTLEVSRLNKNPKIFGVKAVEKIFSDTLELGDNYKTEEKRGKWTVSTNTENMNAYVTGSNNIMKSYIQLKNHKEEDARKIAEKFFKRF